MVKLLSYVQKISGSIPDFGVEIFSNRRLFHGMFGLSVCAFQCPLAIFCPVSSSEKAPVFH